LGRNNKSNSNNIRFFKGAQRIAVILFFLCAFIFIYRIHAFFAGGLNNIKRWFILLNYDSSQYTIEDARILSYDLAILDPDSHPPLEKINNKVITIAYVSLGEAEDYRAYWQEIKEKAWVIGKNPNWKGNYYVDVRDKEWQGIIMDRIIPEIIKKGFKGIMLDTLDMAQFLEESFPQRYPGANKSMVGFVKAIHEKYPQLILISNNGFSILNEIVPYLGGMLAEGITMMPDFEKGGYKDVPEEDRQYKVSILKSIKHGYKIPVFAVDYTWQDDKAGIKKCIEQSRRLGFKPYVAEKELNRVYPGI